MPDISSFENISSLDAVLFAVRLLLDILPYVLPFFLGFALWSLWKNYIQILFMSKMQWVVLEITPPPEAKKTPLSMEIVLSALHQPNPGNFWERIWLGQIVRWSSLEIISIGGEVRFLVRTETRHKNFLEAQIYSQYPSVEIREIPDYVYDVEYHGDNEEWKLWATEYNLSKPDAYPIKTYVDYELDKIAQREDQEELKTDPLTTIIEIFGSIGPQEQLWMQMIIRASSKTYRNKDVWFGDWFGRRDWKGEAKVILKKLKEKVGEGKASKEEQETMAAIEKKISKLGYDTGIRVIYIAKPDAFKNPVTTGLRGMMKGYSTQHLNGFKNQDATSGEYPFEKWDYDLSTFKFKNVAKNQREMFDAYRQRSYFYIPYKRKYFVLNTEELATLFHIPSKAAQTPGLLRIGSHKGTPPTNLPI